MAKRLVTFTPDINVMSAIETLLKHQISGATVVNSQGKMVGILSEIDVMETLIHSSYHGEGSGSVKDFMSEEITSVNPEMGIIDLANLFLEKRFRRLPVVENGKLIGQVSRRDVLKAIQLLAD